MRFLHLSDLHLGKSVNGYSMIEDQEYMLNEIINIIDNKNLDAVLICGDVYDKTIATTEAIKLYDTFLERLVKKGLKVIIISGNHDSAVRLGTGSALMESSGVYLSKEFSKDIKKVTLTDEYGNINFYLLPFIRPIQVRQAYDIEDQITYSQAVKIACEHMNMDNKERNVILSHQFVVGANLSGSEDIVQVGGVDSVESTSYLDADYVALGHIHRAQDVVPKKIRYSGTILKYSFNELNNVKTITIVDMKEKGDISFDEIEIYPLRDLAELKGTFAELTNPTFYNSIDREKYYRIILTDEDELVDIFSTLHAIYPYIMEFGYSNSRSKLKEQITSAEKVEEKSPYELVSEFFAKQNGIDLSEKQEKYLNEKIDSIWREEE